ncbi:MAG: YCF48-related protein [Desulfuromonadaceae bacterium]|nr:YCF48-related protein [Desulfuromonadaceae bacterium]
MKFRILLIALITVVILSSSLAFAAKFWDGFGALMGQKNDKVAVETPYQDILDTPAPRSRFPAKAVLNGVAMAGSRIVVVGQLSQIVYSDDGGKSWTQAGVPVSSDLLAVHFPTPQQGWAVGHDGIVLHSTDGGANWIKQFDGRAAAQVMESHYMGAKTCTGCHVAPDLPKIGKPEKYEAVGLMEEIKKFTDQGADKPFLDVWFADENTGYIVGAFSLIFRTNNGGKSWVPLYDRIDNPKRYHLYAVRPVGKDLFITAEQGVIFKLDEKSGRFNAIKTPYNGTFFGITGKQGAVVAFGMRGNVFRSSDDGASWDKIETGVPAGLVSGTITTDGQFVLVSQGGRVLVSSDSGSSFKQVLIERPMPASGVTSVDTTTIALAGPLGMKIQSIK